MSLSDPCGSIHLTTKGKLMNRCKSCGRGENLVMSGVDAFILGVNVGESCYICANGGYEYVKEAM